MFDSAHVPIRINTITHDGMDKDDAEVSLVNLHCELNPFTSGRAKELDDYVRRTLFTSADAEVNAKLAGAEFNLTILPQSIEVRMASDQGDPTFTIEEAKISGIKAKRSKKSSAWRLLFVITSTYKSDHQLAQMIDCRKKMRYLSFERTAADLFSVADERTKTAKAARASAAAEATH
jgi:hypothetical protein